MFPAVAFGSHYTAQSFVLAWGLLNTLWTVYLCLKIVLATLKSCLFVYEFKSCEFMYSVSHVWQHCTCSVTAWNSPGDNWQGGLPALSNFIYADMDAVLFWANCRQTYSIVCFLTHDPVETFWIYLFRVVSLTETKIHLEGNVWWILVTEWLYLQYSCLFCDGKLL